MKRHRAIVVAVAAVLAAGSGIAYAQQTDRARVAAAPTEIHVVGGYLVLQPGQEGTVRTNPCPPGELAVSGGAFAGGGPGAFTLTASTPWWDQGPRGWFVGGRNSSSQPFNMYAYGFCSAATLSNPLTVDKDGLLAMLPSGPGSPGALPGQVTPGG
ncbi:hypothetical protein [Kitasatospora sp. NPDC093806]|uniref:hypothetical protein n=1 Tax=Kitasatospora sp. NPDC093806 TaxID=3155075 RepID=UPI0034405A29